MKKSGNFVLALSISLSFLIAALFVINNTNCPVTDDLMICESPADEFQIYVYRGLLIAAVGAFVAALRFLYYFGDSPPAKIESLKINDK